MGMMTKMRDNAHVFIIAFAVVFVAFWVVSDADLSAVLQGSQNEIANIDGRAITYPEFQEMVDRIAEQRRQQSNQELDENALSSIREEVWSNFLTQAVIDRAVKDMGIVVTDKEINDIVRGPNPPEELARSFRDSTGRFNREAYDNFLANPGAENIPILIEIEKQIRERLVRDKLTMALSSAIQITDQDLRARYSDEALQLAANFVLFDPRVIAAKDTAAPSDDEYRAWFDKNKEQFKVKEMRKLKYVLFAEQPSAADTAAIRNELDRLVQDANSGADFLELVKTSSETPYQDQFVSRQSLPPNVSSALSNVAPGTVVGPIASETGYSIYKLLETREGTEVLANAAHILFRTDSGQDEAAQKAKADAALRRAKAGEDFKQLAAQLSEEPGAAERGGDLGWFGKGRMVPEFETAVFGAKVGDVVGPIKTQFGWHVIKVAARSSQEIKFAEIRLSIKPSSQTRDDLYETARNFAYFANENGLEAEAAQNKYEVLETPEFAKQSGSYIPNIGVNPALMKFAFENGVGKMSDVHRAANGYVVAIVSEELPSGYRDLEPLKEQLRPQVVYDRQMNKTLEFARSKAKGRSLEQIVADNPSLTMEFTNMFTPGAGPQNLGRDEAFIGTVLRLKQGETSQPIRGQRGVYVLRVENKGGFDETAFKVKKDELRQQTLQQLQNEFIQSWLESQKDKLDVVDNRDRFYR